MTLITFSDGKPVMRDGKVGTEQECCCGCACDQCALCDSDTLNVIIEGNTVNVVDGYGFLILESIDPAPPALGCVRSVNVIFSCFDNQVWEFYKNNIAGLAAAWPISGLVVLVQIGAQSNDDANACGDTRDIFYRLVCDSECCPSSGVEFFRYDETDAGNCDGPMVPPQTQFNLACVNIVDPTYVGVNPLP